MDATQADVVDVSVILPVHNERDNIVPEVDRIRAALDASQYTYEIICIDDASTDGSHEVLESLQGITLITSDVNRGSGASRRVGSQTARGTFVVWTDVDMTYPNDIIPELVDQMDGHDQVVGARRTEEGTVKFLRVPAKWFIRSLAQYLVQTPIPDLNSGLRVMRRSVALQYLHRLPNGFSCVTTITMSFMADNYSVKYVPIDYFPRVGESKFHWYQDTKKYITQVIRMVLSFEPLRVFGPLGFVVGLVAFGKLLFDWFTRGFSLGPNTLVLVTAAFNILLIGLLADLVVRLNRPKQLVPPANVRVVTRARSDTSALTQETPPVRDEASAGISSPAPGTTDTSR